MEITQLLFLLGNVLGMIGKAKGWNAKLIPTLILVQQLLVRFVEGLVAGGGGAATTVAHAAVWGGVGWVFLNAIKDTILAVGLHSTIKNTKQAKG